MMMAKKKFVVQPAPAHIDGIDNEVLLEMAADSMLLDAGYDPVTGTPIGPHFYQRRNLANRMVTFTDANHS